MTLTPYQRRYIESLFLPLETERQEFIQRGRWNFNSDGVADEFLRIAAERGYSAFEKRGRFLVTTPGRAIWRANPFQIAPLAE